MECTEIMYSLKKYLDIITDLYPHILDCVNKCESNIAFVQYGVGGELLHRGYYCPSLIADIILGNAKRGRILMKKSSSCPSNFIYGFDKDKRLVYVQRPGLCEYISHQEQSEIGVGISDDMKINFISECTYNGKQLASYVFCLYDPYEENIIELTEEKYNYLENKLCVDWARIAKSKNTWIKQHERYDFSIENGILTFYKAIKFDENGIEKDVGDSQLFKVKLKRKI